MHSVKVDTSDFSATNQIYYPGVWVQKTELSTYIIMLIL